MQLTSTAAVLGSADLITGVTMTVLGRCLSSSASVQIGLLDQHGGFGAGQWVRTANYATAFRWPTGHFNLSITPPNTLANNITYLFAVEMWLTDSSDSATSWVRMPTHDYSCGFTWGTAGVPWNSWQSTSTTPGATWMQRVRDGLDVTVRVEAAANTRLDHLMVHRHLLSLDELNDLADLLLR